MTGNSGLLPELTRQIPRASACYPVQIIYIHVNVLAEVQGSFTFSPTANASRKRHHTDYLPWMPGRETATAGHTLEPRLQIFS
jgi:hypothetical protein